MGMVLRIAKLKTFIENSIKSTENLLHDPESYTLGSEYYNQLRGRLGALRQVKDILEGNDTIEGDSQNGH